MAGFSDYLETKVLDHVFGGTSYTAPTTLYVALYTAAPTDTGSGFGTVVAMGIFDASTSGNLLAYGALTTSKSVSAGDVFRFNASAIDITLT